MLVPASDVIATRPYFAAGLAQLYRSLSCLLLSSFTADLFPPISEAISRISSAVGHSAPSKRVLDLVNIYLVTPFLRVSISL